METRFFDYLIIGAGPAGLASAQYAARGGLLCAVIDSSLSGGQVGQISELENYPGVYPFQTGSDFMAGMKTIVGGEIKGYTNMIKEARQIATKRMVDEATNLGADAIVNVRFGSSAVMQSAAEIIVYGTAVKLK